MPLRRGPLYFPRMLNQQLSHSNNAMPLTVLPAVLLEVVIKFPRNRTGD
jgi:hypothetical protein